jgi:hypothetical protein
MYLYGLRDYLRDFRKNMEKCLCRARRRVLYWCCLRVDESLVDSAPGAFRELTAGVAGTRSGTEGLRNPGFGSLLIVTFGLLAGEGDELEARRFSCWVRAEDAVTTAGVGVGGSPAEEAKLMVDDDEGPPVTLEVESGTGFCPEDNGVGRGSIAGRFDFEADELVIDFSPPPTGLTPSFRFLISTIRRACPGSLIQAEYLLGLSTTSASGP